MKNFLCLSLSFMFWVSLSAQNTHDNYVPGDESWNTVPGKIVLPGDLSDAPMPIGNILWDNGPIVTNPGGGAGGADASVLQTALGMNTLGWGHQYSAGNWVADDFTVPAGGWTISGFHFFAYQTFSTLTSTINDMHIIIYDGNPGSGGVPVFGDNLTNRLTTTEFSNIFRVLDSSPLNTDRPIMRQYCAVDLTLPQGTYWIAWQVNGTLSSGPWAPPIAITDQTTTGNAIQYVSSASSWQPAQDSGTLTSPGFPFLIEGVPPVPLSGWALFIGIGLILIFAVIRFRKMA